MMKNGCKLPVFAASLVAINAMTILISQRNLGAGVYPVNADSIAIPIASTLLASIAVVPFLLGIAFLPGSAFVSQLLIKRAGWAILIIACLVLLYLPPAAFAVLGGGYWAGPRHYLISLCFGGLLLAFAIYFVLDLMQLFSNSALRRKAKSAAPAS
jgi:hypothetical protein